jgi:hypothetical protein
LRGRFTSLPREETARGTYLTSRALASKSSTSEFSKSSFLVTLITVLSFPATLIRSATALTSESSRNARRLDAYRPACPAFSATSKYRRIRPTFATTSILDLTSLRLALGLALIPISSFLRLALSLLTISLIRRRR